MATPNRMKDYRAGRGLARRMNRGDIVVVAAPGDYGKPRPAVIIQTDALTELGSKSVILCLLSGSEFHSPLFRIPLEPNASNGLEKPSQIMVEKILTVPHNEFPGHPWIWPDHWMAGLIRRRGG